MSEAFSLRELRFVFLHELGHLRRQDMAVNWLMAVLQTLHWFNPVLWLAFGRMRSDRELACDALALSRAAEGENRPYGETIVRILSDLSQPNSMPGLLGILEDKGQMKNRIRMIARFKKTSSWQGWAAGVCAVLAVFTLTDAQTDSAIPNAAPAANPAPSPSKPAGVEKRVIKESVPAQEAKLWLESGKLDEAEAKAREALRQDPDDKYASYYLSLIKEARYAQEARKRQISAKDDLVEVEKTWNDPISREKLPVPNPRETNRVNTSFGRQMIYQKLDKILLDNISYDSLPLSEVVRDLIAKSREKDPDKRGINIIINPYVPDAGVIDPATGAPATFPAVDLNQVPIRLELGQVRLADAIDAVAKVAKIPIRYTVEDYALVFTALVPETPRLFTRTFRVEPQTFLATARNLSRSAGEEETPLADVDGLAPFSDKETSATNSNPGIAILVRNFFVAAGVDFPTNSMTISAGSPQPKGKALFFNDRTGLLLVRATLEELDLVEKAIQVVNAVPPQVLIEAQLIEISQTTTQTLGFDWFLGKTLVKPPTAVGRQRFERSDTNSGGGHHSRTRFDHESNTSSRRPAGLRTAFPA